jgi:5'-methylthioadenosine phosphorylase
MLRCRAVEEGRVLLVQRHAAGHRVPPHKVGYAAMALGLKALGARACIAGAAVGSLRPDWGPGKVSVCSDLIDFSFRNATLFDREVVHTDMGAALDPQLRQALVLELDAAGLDVADGGVYLCANGPRYETPAEVRAMRALGGDVVGMTPGTEAVAMAEAGVPYALVAVVANLGAGLTEERLEHDAVRQAMVERGESVLSAILAVARRFAAE